MNTLKFLKINWHKITAIILFALLLGAYANIFAIDQTYDPGETLDPECVPGEINCTVEIPVSVFTYPGAGVPVSTGLTWDTSKTAPTGDIVGTTDTQYITNKTYNGLSLLGNNTDFNSFVGYNAGLNTVSGAQNNSFFGYEAGKGSASTSFNYYNTGIGYQSLYSNISGSSNSALGDESLYSNTTGSENIAVGYNSLYSNTEGSANIGIGSQALYGNITGSSNSVVGSSSMYNNTTGNFNSSFGASSLYYNTTGESNSAVGGYSLSLNTTGSNNSSIGYNSGVRTSSLAANTTSDYSLYLGAETKALADDDQNEIVIGYGATGKGSNTAIIGNNSITDTYLTGVRLSAGTDVAGTSPLKFTEGTLLETPEAGAMEFDGTNLYFTPSASRKTIAFVEDVASSPITIVNTSSLFSTGLSGTGSGTTAEYSIFFGVDAGKNATNATYSNFLGNGAGLDATSAMASNFFGYYAGETSTGANHSNFFGTQAGYRATSASYSNFLGTYAGEFAVSASKSNFFGTAAGDSAANASYSNFIGDNAGNYALNSSHSNFIGESAGFAAENASNSIFIGNKAGENDTVNNTASASYYSILIGPSTSTGGNRNSIALGGSAKNTASNQFVIGSVTSPIDTTVIYGSGGTICTLTTGTGISCSSDENLKTNIVDLDTNILEKLTQVRTVTFNWKNGNTTSNNIGFIAQDLEKYFPELVTTDPTSYKSVYYANITPILTEAIRELDLKIKDFSSIDISNENSFASLIKKYLSDVANGIEIVFFGEVHTKQLCIDDVCINKDQLQQLLNNSNITNTNTSTVTSATENTDLENAENTDNVDATTDSDTFSENSEEQTEEQASEEQQGGEEESNLSLDTEQVIEGQ